MSSKKGEQDKIAAVQSQVDEVTDVLKQNIELVIERGDKLEDLDDKSYQLEQGSIKFKKTAADLHSHFWWQNARSKCMIGGIVSVVLLVVILAAQPWKW